MSVEPIITFKAGYCDLDESSGKVTPRATPGYIYLYDDELLHFCWRPRSAPLTSPTIDLLMLPSDGFFLPYQKKQVNGRIYVLKFGSSSARHLFWLQSASQSPTGDASYFSPRDVRIGEIVNSLLQGEDVDVQNEIANLPSADNGDGDDDDATMEDVEGTGHEGRSRGGPGAGADATGGDVREEGEGAREGGADGGRANFINSMPGGSSGAAPGQAAQQPQQKLFTTLQDLLTTGSTIPWVEVASEDTVNTLIQFLPPELVNLTKEDSGSNQALSLSSKRDLLKRVLRSPQFVQSLASLTVALRDGGLPSVSEALGIPVANGGYMRRGGVPLGGGDAIETFLTGVKDTVTKNEDNDEEMQS